MADQSDSGCEVQIKNVSAQFDSNSTHYFTIESEWDYADMRLSLSNIDHIPEHIDSVGFIAAGVLVKLTADWWNYSEPNLRHLYIGLYSGGEERIIYHRNVTISPHKPISVQLRVYRNGNVKLTAQDYEGYELMPARMQYISSGRVEYYAILYQPTNCYIPKSKLIDDIKLGPASIVFY